LWPSFISGGDNEIALRSKYNPVVGERATQGASSPKWEAYDALDNPRIDDRRKME
jgi:hypothetical protein